MKTERFELEGLILITPELLRDERGYFCEIIRKSTLQELGIEHDLVQMNQSFSVRNVIRGLHYQAYPKAQGKLVRVVEGRIMDVAVDIRPGSLTFLKWQSVLLDSDVPQLFWIPRGFAHGFRVLSESAIVEYACDEYYDPGLDTGILYSDPELGIDWGMSLPLISDKDKNLPTVRQLKDKLMENSHDSGV